MTSRHYQEMPKGHGAWNQWFGKGDDQGRIGQSDIQLHLAQSQRAAFGGFVSMHVTWLLALPAAARGLHRANNAGEVTVGPRLGCVLHDTSLMHADAVTQSTSKARTLFKRNVKSFSLN